MIIEKYGIKLRTVEISDAEFIIDLRTNSELSRYISSTSSNILAQKKWIKEYKTKESKKEEFYFIAEDSLGERWGTTRIYNISKCNFEIGSWIFKQNSKNNIAVKADILTREFGFSYLKKEQCIFTVNKKNKKVLTYHKAFKPLITSEDEQNFFFSLNRIDFNNHCNKLKKIF